MVIEQKDAFLWAKNGRIERPMSFLKESEVGSVKGEGENEKNN